MPKIYKLSPHEAQKIAAGEVVERPANIVKDLIENAIDAHATQITLYLEEGGKQLIRIIDNGCGMSPEDAVLSFEHHATSKLKTIDDLNGISTFGFRGEALSSIASISKTTLITKEKDADHAYKIVIEQSTILEETIVSSNPGTDIAVHDIFFNVPARKKFLKSSETEYRQIQLLFQAFCLDYLHIHFKMFSDGRQIFNCPSTTDLQQRTMQLWDHNFASNLIPLQENNNDGIRISGTISNHHFARYDRSAIFFFVNKRWVKQQKLSSALLKGYLNVVQPGRFPAAAIFIEINPENVDVNIHPRKEEVQFLNPRKVEAALQQVVKLSLENNLSAQLKKKVTFAPATEVHAISPTAYSGLQFESRYTPHGNSSATAQRAPLAFENKLELDPFESASPEPMNIPITHIATPSFDQSAEVQIEKPSVFYIQENNYTLIGQYNKTYLLLEKEEGLYLVDQHAAHERVLYELFSKRFEEIATVRLMFPQIISLSSASIQMLEPFIELFNQNGIDLQIFSQTELVVQSTPVHLKNQSLNELVTDVLAWIAENQSAEQSQLFKAINEKIHAQMACKAAVKAGDILTREQMEQLLDDLNKSDNRFTCPHGRPTGWLLSTHEIEKKFKRKL